MNDECKNSKNRDAKERERILSDCEKSMKNYEKERRENNSRMSELKKIADAQRNEVTRIKRDEVKY